MKTVASHALGCKVNQYESEAIAELFLKRGYAVKGIEEKAVRDADGLVAFGVRHGGADRALG